MGTELLCHSISAFQLAKARPFYYSFLYVLTNSITIAYPTLCELQAISVLPRCSICELLQEILTFLSRLCWTSKLALWLSDIALHLPNGNCASYSITATIKRRAHCFERCVPYRNSSQMKAKFFKMPRDFLNLALQRHTREDIRTNMVHVRRRVDADRSQTTFASPFLSLLIAQKCSVGVSIPGRHTFN